MCLAATLSRRVVIRLGCVTQRRALMPAAQIWTEAALPWLAALHEVPGSAHQKAFLAPLPTLAPWGCRRSHGACAGQHGADLQHKTSGATMDPGGPMSFRLQALIAIVGLVHLGAWAQNGSVVALTAEETQRALALGPWPQPVEVDKTNRVSGNPMAIELGRRLFRDPRLSPVGYISCVSCHQPDRAFTDKKARGHGLADLTRNTPTLLDLPHKTWYGWAGASDSLWMASIRPLLDRREYDSNPQHIAQVFVRDPELGACYRKVFKASATRNVQRTLVNVGKALAAYQETLVSARTPFDEFRDQLMRHGEKKAASTYPVAAQRGLKLFVGRAACVSCHSGPGFSDGQFHAIPLAPIPGGQAGDDAGRLEAARALKVNVLNLNGRFNDDKTRATARATRQLQVSDTQRGAFRTPGLRNVASTGPYMHHGGIERLQDAIAHAVPPQAGPAGGGDRALSAQDIDDIYAFLQTLGDAYGEGRPWSDKALANCP